MEELQRIAAYLLPWEFSLLDAMRAKCHSHEAWQEDRKLGVVPIHERDGGTGRHPVSPKRSSSTGTDLY